MQLSFSINGVPIRLTKERWKHISQRHPELQSKEAEVLDAIASPHLIQKGDLGTLMAITKTNDKYLVVVYKETSETDGFVITAYYTKVLRRRMIVWKC